MAQLEFIPLRERPQTFHFNVGNVSAPSLGVPNTPTPAAMSLFGQINVPFAQRLSVAHLHVILDGGSGSLVVELWHRTNAGVFTRVAVITQNSGVGNFSQIAAVPAPDTFDEGYFFCQATTATLVTAGGANGITVDLHYA